MFFVFRDKINNLRTTSKKKQVRNLQSFSIDIPDILNMCTTSAAMAGDAAIPGESIEAALIKPGTPLTGPMIQSPVVFLARAPLKVCITRLASKEGIKFRHLDRMYLLKKTKPNKEPMTGEQESRRDKTEKKS